ncbi:MAG TPA: AmmeMemoRadiSam system protein A [Candidatus Acidoferrales bacterium]|nr:AmmeMemoRadiSam system protein A [Candidatus Acidoferrales bacterium]
MCPLTDEEKRSLLFIARQSIEVALSRSTAPPTGSFSGDLAARTGAFVTLHQRGRLRGCIGRVTTLDPLATVVAECAVGAATEDPRFARLEPQDLHELEIEISVLSEPCRIAVPEELQPGVHGLLITHGRNRGILLPQVAQKFKWSRKHFLEETCRKAGLHPDDWKDPGTRIHVFTAEIFSDADFPALSAPAEQPRAENKTPAGSSESAAGRR